MKFTKNCPQCKKIQEYNTKGSLKQAIRRNTVCKICVKENQWKHKSPFEKKCPICREIMSYSVYRSLEFSIKENSKCRKCCAKQQTIYTPEEKIRKIKENNNKSYARPEVKANIKKHAKEYYQRPDIQERTKQLKKDYNKKPEVKKQNIENGRKHRQKYKHDLEYQEKIKQWKKEYYQRPEIKEKNRQKHIEQRKDLIVRLNNNVSGSIRQSLKSKNLSKNGRHWEDLVGYTLQELKDHLEKLFQPGMTWRNKGRDGWHIDHIIPIDFFEYASTDDVEFKYCWSLNNLQPLWAKENIVKSNKLLKKYYST